MYESVYNLSSVKTQTYKYPLGGFPTDTDKLKSGAHFENKVFGE